MRAFVISLFVVASVSIGAAPEQEPAQSFKTVKTLAALEKCLVSELSDLGDPTLMQEKETTTLMIRNGEGAPLLIDISPPQVTITTKTDLETRDRVKHCV